MNLGDLIAYTLATRAIIDVWFNSELFVSPRAHIEAYMGPGMVPPWWARLLSCPYCLAYHAAFWVVWTVVTVGLFAPHPWPTFVQIVVYIIAVAHAAHLVDGLLPPRLRHARRFLITGEGTTHGGSDAEHPRGEDGRG